jgi:hypothetical protein
MGLVGTPLSGNGRKWESGVRRYLRTFGDEYKKLGRKRLIPHML